MSAATEEAEAALLEWMAASTHRQRAVTEERLWAQVPPSQRQFQDRARYLCAIIEAQPYDVRHRRAILNAPDALWAAVDSPVDRVPLGTAVRLYRQMKRAAMDTGYEIERVAVEVLADHRAAPAAKLKDGRVVHKRAGAARLSKPDTAPKKDPSTGRGWRVRLRQVVANIVKRDAAGLSTPDSDELYRWLDAELAALISGFTTRARQLKDAATRPPPGRKQVVAACRALHLEPPSPGEPPDMVGARRQKRRLVRAYHPDAAGNAELRSLYEEVIAAYALLDEYARKLSRPRKVTEQQTEGKEPTT